MAMATRCASFHQGWLGDADAGGRCSIMGIPQMILFSQLPLPDNEIHLQASRLTSECQCPSTCRCSGDVGCISRSNSGRDGARETELLGSGLTPTLRRSGEHIYMYLIGTYIIALYLYISALSFNSTEESGYWYLSS